MFLFNNLNKKKEFLNKKTVKIYSCGITAYDQCHIGHLRSLLTADILIRWLESNKIKVELCRNITDIDDKIIKKSIELNKTCKQITENVLKNTKEILSKLNIKSPIYEPKATEYISFMIDMINTIIKKGYGYEKEGSIYFDLKKYAKEKKYGLFKKTSNISDFVLWKKSKENEPYWNSPWGIGRPGWHIECSTMAKEILGKQFDIHMGGKDLTFPHHENEIAQSTIANECNPAKIWMHMGLVTVNKTKMSKSKQNYIYIQELIDKFHPDVIRFNFLQTHYRKDIEFSYKKLEQSKKILAKIYDKIHSHQVKKGLLTEEFIQAMNQDLNTPLALQQITKKNAKTNNIISMLKLLGFSCDNAKDIIKKSKKLSEQEIKSLIEQRNKYRINGEFQKADKIRSLLQEKDIVLRDIGKKTIWRSS